MSADLFEAFGNPSQDVRTTSTSKIGDTALNPTLITQEPSQSENTWQPWPELITNESRVNNKQHSQSLWEVDETGADVLFDARGSGEAVPSTGNDDDFGDFEQVEIEKQHKDTHHIETQLADRVLLDLSDLELQPAQIAFDEARPNRIAESSGQPLLNDSHLRVEGAKIIPTATEVAPSLSQISSDEEWGDFEATTPGYRNSGDVPTNGKDELVTINASKVRGHLLSIQQEPAPERSLTQKAATSAASGNDDLEDDIWDEFEDDSPSPSTLPPLSVKDEAMQEHADSISTSRTIQRHRPTNMPPPAVLLTWMQSVFSSLGSRARQPGAEQITGDAALQAYRACARIIAGRTLRWKRDTILAQSMRIGSAGRSGGMKLTTLDKGESRKEDQAADEAIGTWTRVSYVLSAAMLKAKVQKPPMALSSKLTARLATGLDVLTANHACATCGLRRNERILGIDVDVSDTFGEFWVEHWGHKDCADTWYQFNMLLDQR